MSEQTAQMTTIEVEAEFAESAKAMVRLLQVMKHLRAEDGCPWDREQTHASLKKYLVEEAYETLAAIDSDNPTEICKELGDVLLQVAFHSQIGKENGAFDFAQVANTVAEKMIYRHPHVFGGRQDIETADDVLKIWEVLKSKEHLSVDTEAEEPKSIVEVPRQLPALMRAEKIQAKASRVGFDWPDISGPKAKVAEELQELAAAKTREEKTAEFGDVLFSLVNLARFMEIEPEAALDLSNEKFVRRFKYLESQIRDSGREWNSYSLAELDQLWEDAKHL